MQALRECTDAEKSELINAIVPYDENVERNAYTYVPETGKRLEEINESLKGYLPIEFYGEESKLNESDINDGGISDVTSMRSHGLSAISKKTSATNFSKLTGFKSKVLPSEPSLIDGAEKR